MEDTKVVPNGCRSGSEYFVRADEENIRPYGILVKEIQDPTLISEVTFIWAEHVSSVAENISMVPFENMILHHEYYQK